MCIKIHKNSCCLRKNVYTKIYEMHKIIFLLHFCIMMMANHYHDNFVIICRCCVARLQRLIIVYWEKMYIQPSIKGNYKTFSS